MYIEDFVKLLIILLFILLLLALNSCIKSYNDVCENVLKNKDSFNTYHTCYKLNDVYYCK